MFSIFSKFKNGLQKTAVAVNRKISGLFTGNREWTEEDFWAQAEESGEFTDARVFRRAKAYAELLIGHVQANDDEITGYLGRFSEKWDVERMSAVDRNIMKVAVAEMLYCPDIPHVVSIDEAIEIAKDFSDEKSGVFINGILNGIKNEVEKKPSGGRTE